MRVGAANSPARWLSENVGEIPQEHTYALMEMQKGWPMLIKSGSKGECIEVFNDPTCQVMCELEKYR